MKYDDMKEIGKVQIAGSTRSYKHPIFSTFESRNVFIEGSQHLHEATRSGHSWVTENKGF